MKLRAGFCVSGWRQRHGAGGRIGAGEGLCRAACGRVWQRAPARRKAKRAEAPEGTRGGGVGREERHVALEPRPIELEHLGRKVEQGAGAIEHGTGAVERVDRTGSEQEVQARSGALEDTLGRSQSNGASNDRKLEQSNAPHLVEDRPRVVGQRERGDGRAAEARERHQEDGPLAPHEPDGADEILRRRKVCVDPEAFIPAKPAFAAAALPTGEALEAGVKIADVAAEAVGDALAAQVAAVARNASVGTVVKLVRVELPPAPGTPGTGWVQAPLPRHTVVRSRRCRWWAVRCSDLSRAGGNGGDGEREGVRVRRVRSRRA